MEIKVLASGSSGNCVYISDGMTSLLLDAGIKFSSIQKGLNFQLSKVTGCLLTHEHGDHSGAIQSIMKSGVDCYMSRGTAEALGLNGHRIHIIEAMKQFQVGTWAIKPFQTHHDAQEPLAFLLANQLHEKVLYATDTAYLAFKFQGLTHILIGCDYSMEILKAGVTEGTVNRQLKRRIVQTHMSLERLLDMLRANDLSMLQEIHLLHLSKTNADAEMFKRKVQEATGKPTYVV